MDAFIYLEENRHQGFINYPLKIHRTYVLEERALAGFYGSGPISYLILFIIKASLVYREKKRKNICEFESHYYVSSVDLCVKLRI